MTLSGRVALVTGGSRGIGRGISTALAAEGAAVAVNYRASKSSADEVVEAITAAGGKAVAVGGDVADWEQAQAVVAETVDQLGGLHILVNNAGISKDALIYNMDPQDWLDVMRVNFGGVFNCTKAAMGEFMGQREGSIINISSVMGQRGWMGESNYSASKGAVNAFTRCCRDGARALRRSRQRRPARLRPDRDGRGAHQQGRRQGRPRSRFRCGLSARSRTSPSSSSSSPARSRST